MKKLLGIVVLGLLLSSNVYSKDNTIKNLEKCINSKSKLLDERNIKNICIFKHQKKLSTKIAKLKKIRANILYKSCGSNAFSATLKGLASSSLPACSDALLLRW